MQTRKTVTSVAMSALLALGISSQANALTITQTKSIADAVSDFTDTSVGDFTTFDASLGILNSVTIKTSVFFDGSVTLENFHPSNASTVTQLDIREDMVVTGPNAGTTVNQAFAVTAVVPVSFTVDPLSSVSKSASGSDMLETTLFGSFGAFIGTGTETYDFLVDATHTVITAITGGATGAGAPDTLIDVTIDVTYDYSEPAEEIPEPGTLALLGMGLIGAAAARRSRRKAA